MFEKGCAYAAFVSEDDRDSGGKRDYRGRWEGNKRKERLQNSPVAGGCVRRYYGCFTSFG